MRYTQLTLEQRYQIQALMKAGKNQTKSSASTNRRSAARYGVTPAGAVTDPSRPTGSAFSAVPTRTGPASPRKPGAGSGDCCARTGALNRSASGWPGKPASTSATKASTSISSPTSRPAARSIVISVARSHAVDATAPPHAGARSRLRSPLTNVPPLSMPVSVLATGRSIPSLASSIGRRW